MKRIADEKDPREGEFSYDFDRATGKPYEMVFWVPGQQTPFSVALYPYRQDNGMTWFLTGDMDKPTLAPSVWVKNTRTTGEVITVWHGWIRDGEAVSV